MTFDRDWHGDFKYGFAFHGIEEKLSKLWKQVIISSGFFGSAKLDHG